MTDLETEPYWITTDQGRLYAQGWRAKGAAAPALPPIILFHDSLGSVALWREFPGHLAQRTGRRVIAYDRLGFGRSDPYPGLLRSSFIRDEASAGLQPLRMRLGIERFVALGHSVGGCMAASAAAQCPGACSAVITESAQAFIEERTLVGIRTAKTMFAQPGQLERLQKYHGEKAAWVLKAWVDTWLSPGFRDWSLDDDLRRVRCPLLALHGENDEYGSAHHPHRIAELSGGPSEVEVFPHCGHVPHREIGEAVLGRIAAWLKPR